MVYVAEVGFQNSARAASSLTTATELSSMSSHDESSNSTDAQAESKPRASSKTFSGLEERTGGGSFDLAWQEMLNAAVAKVNQAEKEMTVREAEHQAKVLTLTAMDTKLKSLFKEYKSSIKKSELVLQHCLKSQAFIQALLFWRSIAFNF